MTRRDFTRPSVSCGMDGCPPLNRVREEPEHVALCSACREKIDALDLLDEPESPEEKRLLDDLEREPRAILAAARLRAGPGALRIGKSRWYPAAAIAAAAAAVVALVATRTARDPLRDLQGASRPVEIALADLPYAPYQPRRGARERNLDSALRKLLEAREQGRAGAERALATLYLVRGGPGDLARAEEAASNDEGIEGAVAYLRGDSLGALDHFLAADAQFNAALALARLGARAQAAKRFDAVPGGPWRAEAQERAKALRTPREPPPSSPRRDAYLALLAAATPEQLAEAEKNAPADLLALAHRLPSGALADHARLYSEYVKLRSQALAGADPRAFEDFARLGAVQADALLWAPALQLAAYVHGARGEWREAQRHELSLASACKVRGCTVENEAIALDELADLAARDGDFAGARRLQDRAEALFNSVNARLQLGELHRKRAAFLSEEHRLTEAAEAAAQALHELSAFAVDVSGRSAFGAALELAAHIEATRSHHRATVALGEAALDEARAAGNRDLEVDVAALLATAEPPAQARARLEAELPRAAHPTAVAALRRSLSATLLAQGDAAQASVEAERGLAAAGSGGSVWDAALLHLAHAQAQRALHRDPSAELKQTLEAVAQSLSSSDEPERFLEQAETLVAEMAHGAANADELALPLDRLRAAVLHVAPAQPGWSRALPEGVCVLIAIPPLSAVARRAGGEVRKGVSAETGCEELWFFGSGAVPAQATGVVTSLSRFFAAEPSQLPRSALFVTAQTSGDAAAVATPLPGADLERGALLHLVPEVAELSGERATPEQALQAAARHRLVHFAVHGFEGGFLQLAGEDGRLSSREIARARLQPATRVVLSSCEAGAPGVAWAFARAGAVAIAAAQGKVDDLAAAQFSQRFYAALSRGLSFAKAAREARDDSARFVVMK